MYNDNIIIFLIYHYDAISFHASALTCSAIRIFLRSMGRIVATEWKIMSICTIGQKNKYYNTE